MFDEKSHLFKNHRTQRNKQGTLLAFITLLTALIGNLRAILAGNTVGQLSGSQNTLLNISWQILTS